MEDRFYQQLKKGVLEMLVLKLLCDSPAHGYGLLQRLKNRSASRFALKEGTLYPILYRLEDDGLIASKWSPGEGRTAPKKIYAATEAGREENLRRQLLWQEFGETVNTFLTGGDNYDQTSLCSGGKPPTESAEGDPQTGHA